MRIDGLILAGGSGRRMGGVVKALLPMGGSPLLLRVADRLRPLCGVVRVVTRRELKALFAPFPFPLVFDEDFEDFPISKVAAGPLGGLHAGCRASIDADRVVAVAADLPFVSTRLLEEEIRLSIDEGRFDAVLPGPAPRIDPLVAVYDPRSIAAAAIRAAEKGETALHRVLSSPELAVRYVSPEECARLDPTGGSFTNLNSLEDLERARARFDR